MRKARGFTLIELMITIIIVAVLATVAGTSYVRASRRTRMATEVNTVFASFKSKIESYKLEKGSYTSGVTVPADDNSFWPGADPDSTADDWTSGTRPAYWTDIGLSPGLVTLYCRYAIFMGSAANDATTTWPGGATKASVIFGTDYMKQEVWYYQRAQCNLQDQGLSPQDSTKWQEWNTRFDNAQVWLVE